MNQQYVQWYVLLRVPNIGASGKISKNCLSQWYYLSQCHSGTKLWQNLKITVSYILFLVPHLAAAAAQVDLWEGGDRRSLVLLCSSPWYSLVGGLELSKGSLLHTHLVEEEGEKALSHLMKCYRRERKREIQWVSLAKSSKYTQSHSDVISCNTHTTTIHSTTRYLPQNSSVLIMCCLLYTSDAADE